MNRTEKVELAKSLKDKFSRASVAIFADYKGLTSNQANELRKSLRQQEAEVLVLKNNIGRVAFKDGDFGEGARSVIEENVGPTMVAFSFGDPSATAKVLHKFAKENEALKLKDSILGQEKLTAAGIESLAALPSREVLIAMLLRTLNGPVTNFVGVLAAVPRSLVLALSAIQGKKEETKN